MLGRVAYSSPPATRTRPSLSRTDWAPSRAVFMWDTGVQVLAVGSKISALARSRVPSEPPATRTRPSPSLVAVATIRGLFMGGPEAQEFVAGVYSSVV